MWNLVRSCCRLVQYFFSVDTSWNRILHEQRLCIVRTPRIYNEATQYISFKQQWKTSIPLPLTRTININQFLIILQKTFKFWGLNINSYKTWEYCLNVVTYSSPKNKYYYFQLKISTIVNEIVILPNILKMFWFLYI